MISETVAIRPARWTDRRFAFTLTQDPRIRKWSTRSQEFSYGEHCEWWERRFRETSTAMWILELGVEEQIPVGLIRYGLVVPDEFHPVLRDEAEISISIAPEHQGHGHGRELLQETMPLARERFRIRRLVALVLVGNAASLRLFRTSSFVDVGTEERLGKQHVRLEAA